LVDIDSQCKRDRLSDIDAKLDHFGAKLDQMDQRTTTMSTTFGAKFDQMDQGFTTMSTTFGAKLDQMDQRTTTMSTTFGAKLDQMDQRTTTMSTTFGAKFDQMDQRFTTMSTTFEAKLDELSTTFGAKLDEISNNLRTGFSLLHDFDRNRVATMRKVTEKVSFSGCAQGAATMFSAYYRGKVARVITPHFSCNGINPFPESIFAHEQLDLAIVSQCQDEGSSVNITADVDIHLGDDVILYGYGETAKVWKGFISGYAEQECGLSTPWYGNASICRGELLVQSFQHNGLSGSPVSNGCGLVGIAHAFPPTSSGAIFAAVIGARFIRELMDKYYQKLSVCAHVSVENLPCFPFSSCAKI
jgi:hypothetical protein